MFGANRLLTTRCLLSRASERIFSQSRASYQTAQVFWPEPFTQQTLEEFLEDIDYFENPSKFINIGLGTSQTESKDRATSTSKAGRETKVPNNKDNTPDSFLAGVKELKSVKVEQLLDMLGENVDPPPLDVDDAAMDMNQLKNLAITSGIYRDLFGEYKPRREHITFTPEQAERMAKLVPSYWISDQPRARADRHLKRTDPLYYFEPLLGISARFVHGLDANKDEKWAHTSYCGNVIPAAGALVRPSISLDGRWLSTQAPNHNKLAGESQFNNWSPGQISHENFEGVPDDRFYTIVMLNLDSIHPKKANLHWMLTNMRPSRTTDQMDFDEVCDYLPVHGIRGFGYSRYVFVVLQHKSKVDLSGLDPKDFSPQSRQFDMGEFIKNNKDINMTPIGLSWFQTVWDESSNQVFHDYLKMKAPVYELVQEKLAKKDLPDKAYPGKIPFNIFMDHYRDTKEINEKVLLERLKTVDPFEYHDQYVPPKVPPTIFEEENMPSWLKSTMFKKHNKIGYWRGLRPASAIIPLNNNADLDYPLRPIVSNKKSLPGHPNLYPAKHKKKPLKELPYSKPINEHPQVFIQEDHEIHLNKVREMMMHLKARET